MNKDILAFLKDCRAAGTPEKTALSPEFVAAAEQVSAAVENWGTEHRVMKPAKGMRGSTIYAANEDISVESISNTIGAETVAELCVKAGVADCHRAAAAGLLRCLRRTPQRAWPGQRRPDSGPACLHEGHR